MRIVRSHGWQGFGFSSLAACPAGGFSWQEFMDSPKSILEKPGAQLLGARNVLWLVVSSIPSRGLGLLLCIPLLGMMQKEPQMVGAWDVLWPWVYHRNGVILFCEGVECGVYCSGWTHRGWVKLGRSNDVATHVVEFLAVENKIFGHSQTHCWMIQKLELISILWVFCFLTRQLEISSWHCEMNGDGK